VRLAEGNQPTAFDLNALSDFVAGVSVSQRSRVFLFASDEVLLAHPTVVGCRAPARRPSSSPWPMRATHSWTPTGRTSGPTTSGRPTARRSISALEQAWAFPDEENRQNRKPWPEGFNRWAERFVALGTVLRECDEAIENLGDRQEMVYLPLGFLGLMVMSYFGKLAERSKRAL